MPWLEFPGARFAAHITRQVESKKTGQQREPETLCIVISLPPELVTPALLLQWVRQD